MESPYLEITYRKGRFFAAYLYLHREAQDSSARTEELEGGLLLDFAADGRPIGVEILAPEDVDLAALNDRLIRAGHEPISPEDLAPLTAA